jgi:hypothetical protein
MWLLPAEFLGLIVKKVRGVNLVHGQFIERSIRRIFYLIPKHLRIRMGWEKGEKEGETYST